MNRKSIVNTIQQSPQHKNTIKRDNPAKNICQKKIGKYNQKYLVRRRNSNEKLDENLQNALQNMEHTKGNQKYVNFVASWVFMSCIIYLIYNNLENTIQH